MAKKVYWLTEEDRNTLRRLFDEWNREQQNASGRVRVDWNDFGSTDVFIARAPIAGIAALDAKTISAAASSLEDDQPGSGTCQIYRLSLTGTIPVLKRMGFTKRVYNLSSTRVPGLRWMVVARTRDGTWVVVAYYDANFVVVEGTGTGTGFDTGTGTGTAGQVVPTAPEGGGCSLAQLRKTDCVEVTDGTQTLTLAYEGGVWTSASTGVGTGTGSDPFGTGTTEGDVLYDYPLGSGIVELWFDGGQLHLSVAGMELLNCGDGCFSGGALTGHASQTEAGAACTGATFTLCANCVECPEEEVPEPVVPTTPTACCANEIPITLYATFSGALAAVGTVPLVHSGGEVWSTGAVAGCGGFTMTFTCVGGVNWAVSAMGGSSFSGIAAESSCDPFVLSMPVTSSGTCFGAATIDITETAP